MNRAITSICLAAAIAILGVGLHPTAAAQTKSKRPPTKTVKKPPSVAVPSDADMPPQTTPTPAPPLAKRNERPDSNSQVPAAADRPAAAVHSVSEPAFRYEFSQPSFVVPSIKIEHDEAGKGTISFKKKGDDETISDPLTVSAASLARINKALDDLDFLNSTENYQYEKDYSHLGVVNFAVTRGGRSRTVTISWTENKSAKALMDEYRRLSNQYIWVFDITLSRDNQPLEAPRLMDSLDSMIRRNEISDVSQMEPFLRELANDERIPLIARNHADRLVKQLEKDRAKEEKKKSGT